MDNEPKKISFGFNKLIKKTNIVLNKEPAKQVENKVQLIDCLEGKFIKVVGGNESIVKGPLVIPMKQPNKKLVNLVDLVKNNFVETVEENGNVQTKEAENGKNETNSSELSLEEQAALELLNASKSVEKKEDNKRIIEVDTDKFVATGEKESSLDDYEDVPVEEFGKAMLRGMGWKDGCGIGKNEKMVQVVQPAIRPKGMGLGADKITKQDPNNKPAVDRDGKVLKCVKRAYVKIIAGYHKGSYGQIMGLDDESGRFIIKTAINNLNISLNEFLVVPVTKDEYNKSSKIINNAKYEEYMKNKEENEKRALESRVKKERKSESSDADEGTSKREEKYKSKNRKSSESNDESYRRKTEKVKKEKYSDSDDDTYKTKRNDDKHRTKTDYDERKYKEKQRNKSDKHKYEKQDEEEDRTRSRDRKSKYDSEEEDRTRSRDRKSKYDSEEEYKRYRKSREKKSKKYSSDISDSEDEKKSKKSSKRDEDYSKKKNKKKKSKKYSSDESDDDQYKRKSKKSEKKYYSDSEDGDRHSKSHKKDKKDKVKYDRDAR